jgi:hypothetical protein
MPVVIGHWGQVCYAVLEWSHLTQKLLSLLYGGHSPQSEWVKNPFFINLFLMYLFVHSFTDSTNDHGMSPMPVLSWGLGTAWPIRSLLSLWWICKWPKHVHQVPVAPALGKGLKFSSQVIHLVRNTMSVSPQMRVTRRQTPPQSPESHSATWNKMPQNLIHYAKKEIHTELCLTSWSLREGAGLIF